MIGVAGFIASIAFEVTSTAHPYRPPPPPPPPQVVTTIYQRAIPAPPGSLDRVSLTRLLVGSAWTRLGSREQIRFVDPPSTGHFSRPPAPNRSRAVAIDLRRDRRTLFVEIDGDLYTIAACQQRIGVRPVLTTCLEHRDDVGTFGGQGYGGFTYGGR